MMAATKGVPPRQELATLSQGTFVNKMRRNPGGEGQLKSLNRQEHEKRWGLPAQKKDTMNIEDFWGDAHQPGDDIN